MFRRNFSNLLLSCLLVAGFVDGSNAAMPSVLNDRAAGGISSGVNAIVRSEAPIRPLIVHEQSASSVEGLPKQAAQRKDGQAQDVLNSLTDNPEMKSIFDADQNARQNIKEADLSDLGKSDQARRKRTKELLSQGALNTANDFYHAAFVFQHGYLADDYLLAHALALTSVSLGKQEAKWIAAATLDRYLGAIKQPQIFGTQFSISSEGKATQEPYNRDLVPDQLRKAVGVPVQSDQEEQRKRLEAMGLKGGPPPSAVEEVRVFAWKPGPMDCGPMAKAIKFEQLSNKRWIVFGEPGGTQEGPAAFVDMVCALSSVRPVAVALEAPPSEQSAINAYIGSDGSQQARDIFLRSLIWSAPIKDGRSSKASFEMYERLRLLRSAGRITAVAATQPIGPVQLGPEAFQKEMATQIVKNTPASGMAIVLVGKFPARLTRAPGMSFMPMAAFLPKGETASIEFVGNGGTSWGCTSPTDCGIKSVAAPEANHALSLVMSKSADTAYSGTLYLGKPTTASPPQE